MLSTVEKVLFLKSIELFSQIPGEDLAQVALIASEERRIPGELIFSEGEPGDALYLVVEGKVRVHKEARRVSKRSRPPADRAGDLPVDGHGDLPLDGAAKRIEDLPEGTRPTRDRPNEERVIADLGARECFGEMAILDAAPRSATVTALEDTSLLRISREDFQEILTEKAEIALGIIKVLSRRLRAAIR